LTTGLGLDTTSTVVVESGKTMASATQLQTWLSSMSLTHLTLKWKVVPCFTYLVVGINIYI